MPLKIFWACCLLGNIVLCREEISQRQANRFPPDTRLQHIPSKTSESVSVSEFLPSPPGLDQQDSLGEGVRSDRRYASKSTFLQFKSNGINDNNNKYLKTKQMETPTFGYDNNGWDKFICNPCICAMDQYQNAYANCTYGRLSRMPPDLHVDVWSLNVSSNVIRFFNLSDTLIYPNMSRLDISNNLIGHIAKTMYFYNSKLEAINFNNNLIDCLLDVRFNVFPNLKYLSLSHNRLTYISFYSLQDCSSLTHLDLSHNKIQKVDTLYSLSNLQQLSLNHNDKLGYTHQPVFGPPPRHWRLRQLHFLRLQCSSHGALAYPNKFLGALINLKTLDIDGLGSGIEFGVELKQLKNLITLRFGFECDRCNIQNISSSFFDNVPYIKSLTFHSCNLVSIDPLAFVSIPNLETYAIIRSISYTLTRGFQDLVGLQNTSLTSLKLNNLNTSRRPCLLSESEGQFLRKLKLEELDLSDNFLEMLGLDFIQCIPRTLKTLILRDNRFSMESTLWGELSFLPVLYELDLSIQNMQVWKGRFFDKAMQHDLLVAHNSEVIIEGRNTIINSRNGNFNQEYRVDQHTRMEEQLPRENYKSIHENGTGIHVHDEMQQKMSPATLRVKALILPPQLTIVVSSEYLFYGAILLFREVDTQNLIHIDFSKSFLTNWGEGILPPTIKTADLSDNFCYTLKSRFFQINNSLTHLNMEMNYLGPVLSSDTNGSIFENANKLQYLNMGFNSILQLPHRFIEGLHNLQTLVLRGNKMQIIDLDFSFTPNLSLIDASMNSITWISQSTRDDLDRLASRHPLRMNLVNNPLPCTCEGIELLQWMISTKVKFASPGLLKCTSSNTTEKLIGDIHTTVHDLRWQCATKYLVIVSSTVIALFLVFHGGALLYRNRSKLIFVRKCLSADVFGVVFGVQPMGNLARGSIYDAYVVYCEDDRDFALGVLLSELEDKRGHRLCIKDRDFLPGTCNHNNITCAIQKSAVVLLILSQDFLNDNDNDLEYALLRAFLEEYSSKKKRDIILALNYKKTSDREMSKDLLMLMRKCQSMDYPYQGEEEDVVETVVQAFWAKLSRKIGYNVDTSTLAEPN